MGKFDVVSHTAKKITMRFKSTADEKLVQNWNKINSDIPSEQADSTSYLTDLNRFWDKVKQNNPLWIPFSLGTGDVEEIQAEIDRLTRKARKKEAITDTEKDFLKSLYGWIAWGGLAKWYPEACQLLRHYLKGQGQTLQINADVYKNSVIVRYATSEMKKVVLDDIKKSGFIRNEGSFSSVGLLKPTPRSLNEQKIKGAIVDNGILLTEQNNKRLKNADNRYPLYMKSTIVSKNPLKISTFWEVKSLWDYDSFETQRKNNKNLITELPLPSGKVLMLPDGLSEYLTQIGIAQTFNYFANWKEEWHAA